MKRSRKRRLRSRPRSRITSRTQSPGSTRKPLRSSRRCDVSDSEPQAVSPDRPRLSSRRYGKSGHAYYIDDVKVDGVTTILNALPKSLTQWAADQAAEEALNNWEELSLLPLTKRMDRIRYAHRETKNKAAMR